MKKLFSSTFGTLILMAAVGFGTYFVNLQVQSYWGRQAFEKTGLNSLSLNDAVARAKKENKRVLVDVSAEWCGLCRKLDNDVLSNDDVRAVIDNRFVFARLDYETREGTEFLAARGVDGTPNLWILNSDGDDIKRLQVTFDPERFIEQLR